MLRAVVRIPGDAEVPGIMGPETDRELSRTETRMESVDGDTVVVITATDTSAMRAALNSHLECMKVVEDIRKLTE
ncbi:MAG: hypothetical protein IKD00_07560 [Candidatus Methanomethylophilaceae archaeon]|nr:hypothetical protein [Candidatus Methanomethylophilaceae archaeon]